MKLRWQRWPVLSVVCVCGLAAQVIQFESGGLRYQTLSREGVTVMYAPMPGRLHEYTTIQAGVLNGSQLSCAVRPEDFTFVRADGTALRGVPARRAVDRLLEHATRGDVIKLISTYESGLSGISQFRSTNGYEMRRQAAQAELGGGKLRAAAAASAIAFVATKLEPGESTDGAVFFETGGKPLGSGRLIVQAGGQSFEFEAPAGPVPKSLQQR